MANGDSEMFLKKRIKNGFNEFVRLSTFKFSPSHIKMNWNLMGDEISIRSSAPGVWMKDPVTGKDMTRKLDAFDRLMFVISDIFSNYYHNVFVQCQCNHSHHKVHQEWEGCNEYGWFSQLYCYECHDYVGEEDIDQYSSDPKPDAYVKRPCPYNEHTPLPADEEDYYEDDYDPFFDVDYYYR